ncbi:MAG: glutathione peroxidase [Ignavibacteriae bacterium]|nr:glutathione peroxidase [Ignavibacteriota bacterium]|tara:strand:- start:62 stop:640 length:579 start_codon:yes stop_codon:yes gene_type:complete
MKKLIIIASIFLIVNLISASDKSLKTNEGKNMESVHEFSVKDINGKDVSLSEYKGKVLLIVNVASKCGYTRQYSGLQKIYDKYKEQGFEILAFPCNDFGGQEPGTNEEIAEFCSTNFNVTFPLFDKIKVLGEDKNPLYKMLTNNSNVEKGDINWNFEKFLISKEGEVIARYKSSVEPESDAVTKAIEQELNK